MNDHAIMITCDVAKLSMLLEDSGELHEDDIGSLRLHLGQCSACSDYRRDLKPTVNGVISALPDRAPGEAVMSTLRKVAWLGAASRLAIRRRRRNAMVVAASILVVASFGWWFMPDPALVHPESQAMAGLVRVALDVSDAETDALDAQSSASTVQDLADQLMILQGLSEDPLDLDFMEVEDEVPGSTDLQWHSMSVHLV